MYRRIIKPILFSLTIERAHHVALLLLRIIGLIPGVRFLHLRLDFAYLIARKETLLHNTYSISFGLDF